MDIFFSGENLVGSVCEAGSGVRAAGEDEKETNVGWRCGSNNWFRITFREMCVSFLKSKWQSDASHCDKLEQLQGD